MTHPPLFRAHARHIQKGIVCLQGSKGGWRRPPAGPGREGLAVARGFHCFVGDRLRVRQRFFDGLLTGVDCRELLAHLGRDAGKLRDGRELDADIGARSTVELFGSADRIESSVICANGTAAVVRVLVERGPCARRHVGPAFVFGNQLDVVLGGCPLDELLGAASLLRAGRDGQCPGPKPVGPLAQTIVGRSAKPTLSATVESSGW
jgi:hypothetical protein